jgi:RecA-family ATPase
MGNPVKRGGVLYIATEGAYTIGERHRAWRLARRCDDTKACKFTSSGVNLRSSGDSKAVISTIRRYVPNIKLVVVDTLSRAMGGGDENTSEDMMAFVEGCDQIRKQTGACVLVIHHMGWQSSRSRGHTALPAAVDTEITVERTKRHERVKLRCSKMRLARPFEPIELFGTEIDLGQGYPSLVFDVEEKAGTQPGAAQQEMDREYIKALRFAEKVYEMGNPLAVEMAQARGHKNADRVNRYAKRVERRYKLVTVKSERQGSSTVNRLVAHLP